VQFFCSSKNPKEIYYQFEDEASPESTAEATPVAIAATPAAVASTAAPAPSSSGPAAAIADEPLKAVDTLRAIIAQKLKKTIGGIRFRPFHNGALGKYTSGLVSRLFGGEMPGGINATSVRAHLSKTPGPGSSRSDGVLLLATTMEPPKRLGSKAWLDTVVAAYAQQTGTSLSSGGAGGSDEVQ
jgi:fatty acid synthase subunit alpha